MTFNGDCATTAMGIMPHRDVARALELALSLDIPFWPQLPKVSFREDMYAQASEGFPGITVDMEGERVLFDSARFDQDLARYSERMNDPDYFLLSEAYSSVYHKFLTVDLKGRVAARGQITGPVSFGFRVVDEAQRPIIYNEAVRTILYDFMQRKCNAQYRQLQGKNASAFVWADEPGLGWVFSGMSGYDDVRARSDYRAFLDGIEGPRALHLCANVNLPYLLELGADIVSFDAYQLGTMPKAYAAPVADFIRRGGIICWGIVPTDSDGLGSGSAESLARLLLGYWAVVSRESGIGVRAIAHRSLLAPARCCLKNVGAVGAAGEEGQGDAACPVSSIEEELVERAFAMLRGLSARLKEACLS
ncbi:MAG: hypothetical protein HYY32_03865 [Chloroflexi bacterium]|nr:hypothetical protein [Chloroflexota bacterium]